MQGLLASRRECLGRAMKDRILTSYLKDFTNDFGLLKFDENELFEHFVNYSIISKHHPESFEPEDVAVGGPGDLGLDGLAIVVNDHLVASKDAVDHLKKALRRLDVDFFFIQSKISSHFDATEIGAVFSGIRQFFGPSVPTGANATIRGLHSVKEYIFDHSIDMEQSPSCRIYFATTGVWTNNQVLQTRADQGVADLLATQLLSSASFVPVDAVALKKLYRDLKQKIVREFLFEKHTILPQINGVQEAYIGIVPCTEYLKLVCDEDGSLNRRLFFDNVRDFQGHNPVNSEIEETIKDATQSDRFALLNNGVTVVARNVNKVGARFRLNDYQIVNGCQTTHILYSNRGMLTPSVYLPLKLIVTTDSDVTNQVIQGTNRQTEVKLEAFESLAPFQKKLEELYLAMGRDRGDPLYYERRSKQYEHLEIRRERIISLAVQVKCFLAMFMNEPHSTHRYYGELLSAYRNRLFSESHSPTSYYVSGLALATLERLFLNGSLPRSWRRDKHQLLMVYRLQYEPDLPALNSRGLEKYCDGLLTKLGDALVVKADFRRAGELTEAVRRRLSPFREPPERTRAFTEALEKAVGRSVQSSLAKTDQETGTVKRFSDIRGYGFVERDAGGDAFVHYSSISGKGYRSLSDGQRVRFSVVETPRGIKAVDVEPI